MEGKGDFRDPDGLKLWEFRFRIEGFGFRVWG